MVCLLAAPWVQLSVSAGNGWLHNALRHHWLMPISCHFRDCKALLVTSLTHVSGAIASVQTFTFTFTFSFTFANLQMMSAVFWQPSRYWSIDLPILLTRTLGFWRSCWDWRCWVADNLPKFRVRQQCLSETTPCWIFWYRKSSASSFWKPYSELINSMCATLSHKREVRKQRCCNLICVK